MNERKCRWLPWIAPSSAVLLALAVSGCSSTGTAPKAQKAQQQAGHWVYLPAETGSRLPRRVWQNEDGTLVDPNTGRVFHGDSDVAGQLQRQQSLASPSGGR